MEPDGEAGVVELHPVVNDVVDAVDAAPNTDDQVTDTSIGENDTDKAVA